MNWRRLLSCSQWYEHSVALPVLKSKISKVSNSNFKALREILGPSCDELYAYLFLGRIPVIGSHQGKYVILQQGESGLALKFPFALLRPWVPGACFDFPLVQKVVSAIPTGLWKRDISISVFKYLVYLCGHRC